MSDDRLTPDQLEALEERTRRRFADPDFRARLDERTPGWLKTRWAELEQDDEVQATIRRIRAGEEPLRQTTRADLLALLAECDE